jgi:lipoprotein signal peptidase
LQRHNEILRLGPNVLPISDLPATAVGTLGASRMARMPAPPGVTVTRAPRPVASLLLTAALVALLDQLSKLVATMWLRGELELAPWLSLLALHNAAGPLGVSLGSWTRGVNVVLAVGTIALVLAVARDLARAVRGAPLALGLVAGAALGNLLSLVSAPRGVLDFIAVQVGGSAIVLNVADIAAYAGLALLGVLAFRIVAELRARLRAQVQDVRPTATVLALHTGEREVVRPVFVEGAGRGRGSWTPARPLGVPGVSREGGAGEGARILRLRALDPLAPERDRDQAGELP